MAREEVIYFRQSLQFGAHAEGVATRHLTRNHKVKTSIPSSFVFLHGCVNAFVSLRMPSFQNYFALVFKKSLQFRKERCVCFRRKVAVIVCTEVTKFQPTSIKNICPSAILFLLFTESVPNMIG